MLTTLKSDACKISAEVNELVVHGKNIFYGEATA